MKRSTTLFSLFVVLTTHADAGVVFEIETKDHPSQETGLVVTSAEGKNLKIVISTADRAT